MAINKFNLINFMQTYMITSWGGLKWANIHFDVVVNTWEEIDTVLFLYIFKNLIKVLNNVKYMSYFGNVEVVNKIDIIVTNFRASVVLMLMFPF